MTQTEWFVIPEVTQLLTIQIRNTFPFKRILTNFPFFSLFKKIPVSFHCLPSYLDLCTVVEVIVQFHLQIHLLHFHFGVLVAI